MAGLRATAARLAAYRRQWEKLNTAIIPGQGAGSPTELSEHTDFGANPGQLRMLSHVPDGLPPRAPLVVVLHGCKQDASGYARQRRLDGARRQAGLAVLLPEQRASNNANSCFNWFVPGDTTRDQGEAASIRQMIERIVADHDLDRARIFVTGLSAGGAMAAVMLATYPEVFAGGAIVAGLPFGVARNVQEAFDAMFQSASRSAEELGDKVRKASPHKGPWPRVSVWHGSADTTVKLSNAGETEKQWIDVHGLHASAVEAQKTDGQIRRVWRNAAGEAMVESYTIAGMAHGTPIAAALGAEGGGSPAPFILEAGIASTIRIAEFWGLAAGTAAAAVRPRNRKDAATGKPDVIYLPGSVSAPNATTANGKASNGKAKPSRPAQAASTQTRNPVSQGRFGIDPQAVIDKALKAAGLLKR
jgi:feruloyl esterase